jgi:ATP-binding protein involved in chromosome partitioning
VENMSGHECPHCKEMVEIFGKGGGEELAKDMELNFLGAVPLDVQVREAGDAGMPLVKSNPESPAARALREMAGAVVDVLEG